MSYQYDQGLMTGSPGWLDANTYHRNGLVSQTKQPTEASEYTVIACCRGTLSTSIRDVFCVTEESVVMAFSRWVSRTGTATVLVLGGSRNFHSGRTLSDFPMPRSLLLRTVDAINFAIATRRLGPLMALFDDEAELIIDDGRRRRAVFGPWAIRASFLLDLPKARVVLLTEWREPTGELVGTFSHVTRPETPVGRLRLLPRGDRIARLECKRTVTYDD